MYVYLLDIGLCTGLGFGRSTINKRLRHNLESDLFSSVHEEIMMFPVLERILPDPDGLAVIVSSRMLEAVGGNQDVIKELQTDLDTFFAAVLDLSNQNLLDIRSEDQHSEPDPSVRRSITFQDETSIINLQHIHYSIYLGK